MIDVRMTRSEARRVAVARAEARVARLRLVRAASQFSAMRDMPVSDVTEDELEEDMFYIVASRAAELAGTEPTEHAAPGLGPVGPRIFWAVGCSHGAINNGGFHEYFWNPTADLAAAAHEGLTLVGSPERAALLRRAMARFPGGIAPLAREERQTLLGAIDYDSDWQPWIRPIEDAYYALDDTAPLEPLLIAFAREHQGEFFLDP